MRIDLNAEESRALGMVLNSALDVLRKGEAGAGNEFAGLRKGYQVLMDLQRRLTGLDVSHKEADFMAAAIQEVVDAVGEQNAAAFKKVQEQVRLYRIELDAQDSLTLGAALDTGLRALQIESGNDIDPGNLSAMAKGQAEIAELARRLRGLELDQQEAGFLREVVRQTIRFLEASEKKAHDNDLVLSIGSLIGVQDRIAAPMVELSDSENLVLRSAIHQALKTVRELMSSEKDPDAQRSFEKGEQALAELGSRLGSIEVNKTEGQFLAAVIQTTVDAIKRGDLKMGWGPEAIDRVRDRLQSALSK